MGRWIIAASTIYPRGMPSLLESSLFDTIGGLPVHPLVVHFAVVLLPVAALALVLEVLVPALRRRYAGVTVLALAGGTLAAFVAKESGEALARSEGLPAAHALFGNILPPLAAVLLLVATGWYFVQRRAGRPDAPGAAASLGATIGGLVAAVLAVAVTVLTVLVGHSGAQAVWKGEPVAAAPATASATPSASATTAGASASPSAGPSAPASATPTATPLTAAAVKQHATASSCWAIVSGNVYDLTSWIARHPGGQQRIIGMCGTDATTQFVAQHGSSSRVAQTLAGFKLGALAT